jgi:exopolyphosphatase/guanosine-5'-triphosphate,3'-diphosphate pyrophosphatase
MIVAAIDVGSNTLRLLICNVENGKIREVLYEDRKITRLAENLIKTHYLSNKAIDRTIEALKDFKHSIDKFNPHKINIVATSAVREAKNSNIFLNKAREIGLNVEVIDSSKEGYYTYLGVSSVVELNDKKGVIFDIGGGSTEFIYTHAKDIVNVHSLEIGVVKIANIYDLNNIVDDDLQKEISLYIKKWLQQLDNTFKTELLIGTAGTVTTIAAIDLQMDKYDSALINNYKLEHTRIKHIYNLLKQLPAKERLNVVGLEEGREDLIVAGILMVLEILRYFSKDYLIVCDYGLREGLAIAASLD